MAKDLVIKAQKNPHITAKELKKKKKSSRHRFSCSQFNNATYFKQHGRVARKNDLKPEAFWNKVLKVI